MKNDQDNYYFEFNERTGDVTVFRIVHDKDGKRIEQVIKDKVPVSKLNFKQSPIKRILQIIKRIWTRK